MRSRRRTRLAVMVGALSAAVLALPLSAAPGTAQVAGTWTRQTAPVTENQDLQGVYFINPTTGWAVGGTSDGSGLALYTRDGGTTWTKATATGNDKLYAVHFVSTSKGFAVGASSTILVSTDGGASWSPNGSQPEAGEYRDVQFGDATHGCAVAHSGVAACTDDGGTTWTVVPGTRFPDCGRLEGIGYGSPSIAYIAGECGVLKSTNANAAVGSIAFTEVSTLPTGWGSVDDVSCGDPTHCTIVGNDNDAGAGVVASTSNGSTFTSQTVCVSGQGAEAANMVAGDTNDAWMGGLKDQSTEGFLGSAGQICSTGNAGGTWANSFAPGAEVMDIWFTDQCHGWAVTETDPVGPQLGIYAFNGNCPSPSPSGAAAPAAVGLPKAGGPGTRAAGIADAALILLVLIIIGAAGPATLLRRRRRAG